MYSWLAFLGPAIIAWLIVRYYGNEEHLHHIPTVGSSLPILSSISAVKYLFFAQEMIAYGYQKFRSRPFKVPYLGRWLVLISDPQQIEEALNAPDRQLSFADAVGESIKVKYTLGIPLDDHPYHLGVIRTSLTRNLDVVFPELRSEVIDALEELIPLEGNEWTKVPALNIIMRVVARASNRIFVGLPLCRDPEWLDICLGFAGDMMKTASIIRTFPSILQPIVGSFLKGPPKKIDRAMKLLQPLVEERRKLINQYGKDYPNKTNDLLSWLMDEAKDEEQTLRRLTVRVLALNFAAIHTSSMLFTQTLFNLATNPARWTGPLRSEVDAAIKQHGWTKSAVSSLPKIESFIKESARINSMRPISVVRYARQPFTFSDGTYVPRGTFVAACSQAIHRDSLRYPDGNVFDGFRFADMREREGDDVGRLTVTGTDWLEFGHKRHACPGRHYAAAELQMMLAHVVTTYDVKMEKEGVRPRSYHIGDANIPDPTAVVMLRKRQVV